MTTEIIERPILFTGKMVRAIKDDSKTHTRRVINRLTGRGPITEFGRSNTKGYEFHFRDRHALWNDVNLDYVMARCPYGVPGDRLWVRETFATHRVLDYLPPRQSGINSPFWYRADGGSKNLRGFNGEVPGKWRPSIHMPRWASRINLEVVRVWIEQVRDITDADAIAEGIDVWNGQRVSRIPDAPRQFFGDLWNSINEPRGFGWGMNPWVWCVEFKRLKGD